jgi:plasmid stability protein
MPSITLKGLPRDLHRALKARAKAHHRSLNREVLATLQNATKQTHLVEPTAMIQEARGVRKKFKRHVSSAQIRDWIRHGRLSVAP